MEWLEIMMRIHQTIFYHANDWADWMDKNHRYKQMMAFSTGRMYVCEFGVRLYDNRCTFVGNSILELRDLCTISHTVRSTLPSFVSPAGKQTAQLEKGTAEMWRNAWTMSLPLTWADVLVAVMR